MCNNAFIFRRPVAEQTSYSRVTVINQATSTTRLACSSEDSVKSINCITHHLLPISVMNLIEVSIILSLSMLLENWLRGVFLAFINVVLCVKDESLVGRCESLIYLHSHKPRIGKDKRILVWSETKVNNVEQDLIVTILDIRRLWKKIKTGASTRSRVRNERCTPSKMPGDSRRNGGTNLKLLVKWKL